MSMAETPATSRPAPPIGMLAELTHRCPLQCPYCSNPIDLARRSEELSTAEWVEVMQQAARLGVLQVHLSGGEPTARKDLDEIVVAAHAAGLYTNLITAGVLLNCEGLLRLAEAGLDHVQLSVQDSEPGNADHIGNFKGGHIRKLEVARWVREVGLPLTINAVVHRQNLDHLEDIIALAHGLGAHRLEIANVQYYGVGVAQSRRADANPRSARAGHRHGGNPPLRLPRRDGNRLYSARLFCPPPQALHGRMGKSVLRGDPAWQSIALPRRGNHLWYGLLFGASTTVELDLGPRRCFQPISRYPMDAGTLSRLRIP